MYGINRQIIMATREKLDVVNLRIDEVRKNLIDEAAKIKGKSRTEFMVEAAYREAEQIILDQKIYILDEADCEYLSATNHKSDPMLVKLFKSKSPWEQ